MADEKPEWLSDDVDVKRGLRKTSADGYSAIPSEHALVVGHPYIDVWEAVKPASVGIEAWPRVPRGQDWKTGVCRALGWPENTGATWQHILSRVRSYKDLEPQLLGRVEELIDFVTESGGA